MAKAQALISSRRIKKDLRLPVSTATIRRCLCDAKQPARSPHNVPLLKNKKQLQFAKEHIDSPKKKCRNILWTDESRIVLFGSGPPTVKHPANSEFKPRYTVKMIKPGDSSIMI